MAHPVAAQSAPLSFEQQQLWLLSQLMPDLPVCTRGLLLDLRGPLAPEALEWSLGEIIRRHELWRTSFPFLDESPMQVVHAAAPFSLPVLDLRSLPQGQQEEEVKRRTREAVRLPFDLARGPLLRAMLFRLGDADHRLCLSVHAIIADDISLSQIFLAELQTLYRAFVSGGSSPLADPALQYRALALQQRERFERGEFASHLAYWKRQLANAPAALELPADRPRSPAPGAAAATIPFTCSASLTEALRALCRERGGTLAELLLAALSALLFRYAGQEDVLIGMKTSGRCGTAQRSLLGPFARTLAIRTSPSGSLCFGDLFKGVKQVVRDAQAHQEVPFEPLAGELPSHLEQTPLLQVLLALAPPAAPLAEGWTATALPAQASPFDLSLLVEERPGGLAGRFVYRTDLFDAATIQRLARHWQALLEGIVADPRQCLAQLPLLSKGERHRLLVEWNATQAAYPRQTCVHQLFEEQVERTPEAVAVVFEGKQLTYRELNRRANQLAHHLQRLGVKPEVLVGVCVERSVELIVALLGILKAGGVYVPLDPDYPRERLAFLMQDTQMPVLLTQERLLSRLPQVPVHLLCLDRDRMRTEQHSPANPNRESGGEQLAYVIYTSGSTGQPKGVLIEHQALAAHCWSIARVYGLCARDHVLQFSTFTFDASLEQIVSTLLVGARLVLRGPDLWSPAQLLRQVQEQQLSVMNLPPAYWQQVTHAWLHVPARLPEHELRLVIVGGDQLPAETLRLWRQTPFAAVRLLNAYGPTETVITATLYDTVGCTDGSASFQRVPIGRPLPNRKVYVLDEVGQPVPEGVVGELHIGGELLARGYLRRPELTAERFVADPFSQDPQARLYKTGDLARYRPDGELEFLGRTDQQVKVRGYRIELGEIEAALLNHPAVRETVVMAREDEPGKQQLVAYLVFSAGPPTATHRLQDYLKAHLPPYMVPTVFVTLSSLPLTPGGKVDRQALPAPTPVCAAGAREIIGMTTQMQHRLAGIWEELLHVHPIGLRDNFFTLGGHSLLAVRMLSLVEQICGQRLPMSALFEEATIEHLAAVLERGGEQSAPTRLIPVQHGGSRPPFFFLHGAWKGGAFYCLKLARAFGPEQPFYALDPYRFDGEGVPPTIEEIAAVHIRDMRQVQPTGPYILGGFCNGALFACEMAQQLRAAGEQVPLLILIDPDRLSYHHHVHQLTRALGRLLHMSLAQQLEAFLVYEFGYRIFRHLKRKGGALRRRLLAKQQGDKGPKAQDVGTPLDGRPPLLPTRRALHLYWGDTFGWVVNNYTPRPYPGKAVLLWTRDYLANKDQWLALTDPEETVHALMRGSHITCRTRHLDALAEDLRACLERAQESPTPNK